MRAGECGSRTAGTVLGSVVIAGGCVIDADSSFFLDSQ